MTTEYLVMLTTTSKPHLNCSKRAGSISAAAKMAWEFTVEHNLTESDMRSDFGEIMVIRPAADGIGDFCKTIAYWSPTERNTMMVRFI